MTTSTLHWREQLLPGPGTDDGYRTVLLVGTTGAGKTTLIRQLIGTDPATEPFPATSTFKTTTAETEILCAPGDYYAVAVFAERIRVRAEIEDCVVAAAAAIAEGRPHNVARDALAAHADERLRLEYVLGTDWLDAAVSAIESVLAHRPAANLEEIAERVRVEPTLRALVDHLLADVAARFTTLRFGQLLTDSDDTWPRCWQFTTDERATLFSAIRRLAGNERGSHGTLLSPMVEALRVRGPLHPTWAAEIPYLMAVDTEGLGHVPLTASALPLAVIAQLERADRIIVVDDATHPMQAAPLAALRQLVMAGQLDKLALCFTHADGVVGPNIATDQDRDSLLRRSINQAVLSMRDDLGEAAWRALTHQLDTHHFVLGHLDQRLDRRDPTQAPVIAELHRLLGWLRKEHAPIDTSTLRPVYRLNDLRSRLLAAAEQFATAWPEMLNKMHWRQVQALCRRIADGGEGYGDLQPVAQLTTSMLQAIRDFVDRPIRWTNVVPADDQQLALFDGFLRTVTADVLVICRNELAANRRAEWDMASETVGMASNAQRVAALTAGVFQTLPHIGNGGPSLVGSLTEVIRHAAIGAGFDIGDVVTPATNVFGRALPPPRRPRLAPPRAS